jgi:hypothetical protein
MQADEEMPRAMWRWDLMSVVKAHYKATPLQKF